MIQQRPTALVPLVLLFFIGVAQAHFLYFLDFTPRMKIEFVSEHNKIRANVKPPAANMRRLSWDDKVEEKAREFVKRCSFHHSKKHMRTDDIYALGENVYAGDEFYYDELPWGVTESWFKESNYYDINRDPPCESGKVCGHYTQLIWAKSTKIGCAAARCDKIQGGNGVTLVACIYGPAGNEYSYAGPVPPYIIGDTCSKCPNDSPYCVNSLCA